MNECMTQFDKQKRRGSATETLPLPIDSESKERYRRIQNEFEKRNMVSFHEYTREKIEQLLDEAERFLDRPA